MSAVRLSRGHPIVALLAVLGGWVGGRAATWDAPMAAVLQASAPGTMAPPGPQSLPGSAQDVDPARPATYQAAEGYPAPYPPAAFAGPQYPAVYPPSGYVFMRSRDGRQGGGQGGWTLAGEPGSFRGYPNQAYAAPGLREDFARFEPLPRFFAPAPAGDVAGTTAVPAAPPKPRRLRRWSLDAWALLRRDNTDAPSSPGALPGTYGGSQAGMVLRYALRPSSPYQPRIYLRSTSAKGSVGENTVALGLSARPLPRFPVVAAVEARLTDQDGTRRYQPVAMAVTELPPFPLPWGLRGEAYAQAGYVAGKFATPFADGQFRADRALFRLGSAQARLGGGVWAGAQKGAGRFDAGPSATLSMPLGRGLYGRAAVDWRFRVLGNAAPGSGPAVTLSAGF